VHLKKIEIAGFKSFADRTVIDFEQGVTAIVGPNGSGKSNITEALRWVLGEQSAKSLRGGKMPDIIFAGSDTRKPLNIAEVTVVLDNTDHYLPLDFSEISVTRRYRRSGESDFFINKKASRLKDIQELFMDSGLGKESFSIISQGKVEAIFNSKPEDRRGIFEEAAGVLKYKQRKKKAEQKLFETEDNLNRLEDIIYELEEQLAPLSEQSRVAQNYLRLKEELTSIDVSLTSTEVSANKVVLDAKNVELAELEHAVKEATDNTTRVETELFTLRGKRNQLDEELEQVSQQLLAITEAHKSAEGQQNVLLERSKNTEQNAEEVQKNYAETQTKISKLIGEVDAIRKEISEKEKELEIVQVKRDEAQVAFEKYSKSSKEILEELRAEYVEVMQESVQFSNELKYLERSYEQETTKNAQTVQQFEELAAQVKQADSEKIAAQENLEDAKEQVQAQIESFKEIAQSHEIAKEDLRIKQQQMYKMMNQLQQTKAREKSLRDIHENYQGYYQGVKAVLQHKQELSGIVGSVAELIQVQPEHSVAIETALGGTAQHIVVENEKDGQAAIRFLKEQRAGRATFLPLTTIKPRNISATQRELVAKNDGFVSVASELVTFPKKVTTIIQNILGLTVIARDLASANRIARMINYQYRVVSLEGDVMNPGGSMTGGASKRGNQGSLFAQGQELEILSKNRKKFEQELEVAEKSVQEVQKKVTDLQETLETTRLDGEQLRLAEVEAKNELENAENTLNRLIKERQTFEVEAKGLGQFLSQYETNKSELEIKLQQAEDTKADLDEQMKTVDAEAEQNEAKREEANQVLNQAQAQLAVVKEQLSHLGSTLQERAGQLTQEKTRLQTIELQLSTLQADSSVHVETKESLTQQISLLAERKEKLQKTQEKLKEERLQVGRLVVTTDEQLTVLNRTQQQLLQDKAKLEVEKNRADMNLDNLLCYLQEEYSLTYEAALEKSEPLEDTVLAKQQVRNLKREIDHLGPVNLSAIEQYELVNERYSFLTTQRDDLLEAKQSLFDTMDEMDVEVKTRFKEVFDDIRKHFTKTFPSMFGGGRAELILTNPEDLLNTGIEIEAQPPGKKLQNLSLLSGGERALTAIALLFSIIQVRPVPFCVLDEVEAALDEANVARFGHYLSHFEDETQFIVVTHRKGTMESANVLYGVTMQESGVSKIVSVRLEDVEEDGKIVEKKKQA
jgi:chromosome segregation protein